LAELWLLTQSTLAPTSGSLAGVFLWDLLLCQAVSCYSVSACQPQLLCKLHVIFDLLHVIGMGILKILW